MAMVTLCWSQRHPCVEKVCQREIANVNSTEENINDGTQCRKIVYLFLFGTRFAESN